MKIKFLVLVIYLKKKDYNTKVTEIENKLNDNNHDQYIDPSKFNTLATNLFNTRKAQANLITKTHFDAKMSSLNRKKVLKIKQIIYLLKMN